ncbi:protoheme IX farnesyltransferase [Candidatus Kryptobacter tengchongensis]|uniref:Protoheme IX farnesyltransferase n=1 Tax=Kryptobacter tengchongensis TaxID=1643429 RepID=A0A916LK82_KRYT1|nr:heme o synthase [Candidatus Kryptobacter tengchongensis]CUT00198.1 protoheme IX farnesyltransferase [Candidatus Kryptobacter tengchongensis]CUT03886.1 protoheme IX farnesyltransferase [Candidatus Kryptobacter tengchongensis]CUU02228.1 protoheme IX farnesyltransferase [Candidatus Kryptobacter tengchongensis]
MFRSFSIFLNDFLLLIKHRLTSLVVFTTAMGYLIANRGDIELFNFIMTILGVFLVVGSANAMNQVFEVKVDGMMKRTASRPLPSRRMQKKTAILISILMLASGQYILYKFVNGISGLLALIAFVIYVFAYTPLKRITPLCTFVGAIPGAIPPVIGWTAVRGQIELGAIILFGIQFIWQFPHFWSIALLCKSDYERAGFKVLPSSDNRITAVNLVIYTFMLLPMGLMPTIAGFAGKYALVVSIFGGGLFFLQTLSLFKDNSMRSAKKIMFMAEIYLPLILIFLLIDKI